MNFFGFILAGLIILFLIFGAQFEFNTEEGCSVWGVRVAEIKRLRVVVEKSSCVVKERK